LYWANHGGMRHVSVPVFALTDPSVTMMRNILITTSICALAQLIICWILATPALACSIFSLAEGGAVVCGRNLDLDGPLPGHVIVNPRGITKAILPWKGSWPVDYEGEPETWVSGYGSITFTCYGRDFIESGMNEAGLVIMETSLWAVYPPEDDRPGVSCGQWMQYQLDNYATVEEVLLHLGDLRPDGEGWHYLVADSTGVSAVIEYTNGEPFVIAGDSLEVPALTNTMYRQAYPHIAMDSAFGGDTDIASGSDSYARFVRMAALMRDYAPRDGGPPVPYAFHILGEISCGQTLRSVVFDATGKSVFWKTSSNQEIRWLEMVSLDLSAGAGVLTIDVNEGAPGDASKSLTSYSVEANRAVVIRTKGPGARDALGLIAEYPTSVTAPSGAH